MVYVLQSCQQPEGNGRAMSLEGPISNTTIIRFAPSFYLVEAALGRSITLRTVVFDVPDDNNGSSTGSRISTLTLENVSNLTYSSMDHEYSFLGQVPRTSVKSSTDVPTAKQYKVVVRWVSNRTRDDREHLTATLIEMN